MVSWFHEHFEDPAQRTSYVSAEGGYLWNYGGPYDAREELYSQFGDIVTEKLIEEVAEEVEADGITDWAPTPSDDDYDDVEPPDEPPSLEIFSGERGPRYGSAADHHARERARTSLKRLQDALDAAKPVGIGHNQPRLRLSRLMSRHFGM